MSDPHVSEEWADSSHVTSTDDELEAAAERYRQDTGWTMAEGHAVVEAFLAGAAAGFRRTVQGDAGVEYRARATTGHVYGDVRITPEFAVAAYEEALDRETFEQDDETPVVETRRVGPWLPVEQEDNHA